MINKNIKLNILIALVIVSFFTSCSDDDNSSQSQQIVEAEIELPNFVAYNTGMTPVLPEGIEFDIDRESFIVSSAAGAGISLIGIDGAVSNLVPPANFGGNGIFGLQIDKSNGRLLAVSSNLQNPMVANLFIFNLSDGSLIHNVDLATLSPGLNFVNDVAVDSDGNAYVSNSDQGIVFKVDMNGNSSIFFQDENFAPADPTMETGFNGIEYHHDGYLIISHYESNKIYKLDISSPSSIQEVNLPSGFVSGGDGIYLSDDELVVVNNNGLPFVSKFVSSDNWVSATLEGSTYATGDIFPTAVVKIGEDYMVSNSYFNFPAYGNTPVDYLISKANFDAEKRYAGSANEIPRVNTPIVPFGYGTEYPAPYYADCSTPIGTGIPDLRGDWSEETVIIDGVEYPAQADVHSERIEQCGNRLLVVTKGVLHEIFLDDDSMYNGTNDVNPMGPAHATGRFDGNSLILTGVFPSEFMLPDGITGVATRDLIQDDSGIEVLRFFNPLVGSTRYLVKL